MAKGLQSVKYSLLQYHKNPKIGPNRRAKRKDPFGFFNIQNICCKYTVAKYQKHFGEIENFKKIVSQCRKTLKLKEDPSEFFNIYSVAKCQKIEWGLCKDLRPQCFSDHMQT